MSSSVFRSLTVLADGRELASGCHIRLSGSEVLSLRPGFFLLTIEDLSPSSEVLLSSAREVRVLSGSSILASGPVSDVYSDTVGGIRKTRVAISPGLTLWESAVSITLPAGIRLSDTVRALLSDSGAGVSLAGFTGLDPLYSRPQSFFGRTTDALLSLADTAGSLAYLSPAGLVFSSRSATAPTLILTTFDLLSAPSSESGHTVISTGMTGWPTGAWARYTWHDQSGEGRIISRSVDADNVSGPWKSELLLVPVEI